MTYRIVYVCLWCDDDYPESAGISYIGDDFEECKKHFEEFMAQIAEADPDRPKNMYPACRCQGPTYCTFDEAFEHFQEGHYINHPIMLYYEKIV